RIVRRAVPLFVPLAQIAGRLAPIAYYPSLKLPRDIHREWSVLDTFDMYSPKYDKPQTLSAVRGWFADAGLRESDVRFGPNGIVGRGVKPR
ncbi:MAG: class I SAM-dependent methyltransferase, partial [bacterium]|nr:class I SAM-dependent methyltransferase [bacterium]